MFSEIYRNCSGNLMRKNVGSRLWSKVSEECRMPRRVAKRPQPLGLAAWAMEGPCRPVPRAPKPPHGLPHLPWQPRKWGALGFGRMGRPASPCWGTAAKEGMGGMLGCPLLQVDPLPFLLYKERNPLLSLHTILSTCWPLPLSLSLPRGVLHIRQKAAPLPPIVLRPRWWNTVGLDHRMRGYRRRDRPFDPRIEKD
jgi:hypothetical protein